MQTIKTDHWTADFQLSRACWEVHQEEPRDGIHIICVGDPGHPADRTVLEIGEELSRYHPDVHGTLSEPVTGANLRDVVEAQLARLERAFLIVIAGTWSAADAGHIRVATGAALDGGVRAPDWVELRAPVDGVERGPSAQEDEPHRVRSSDEEPAEPEATPVEPEAPSTELEPDASQTGAEASWVVYPDVAVLPVLALRQPGGTVNVLPPQVRNTCRDVIIDGMLRLYSRSGWDHTQFSRRRAQAPRA